MQELSSVKAHANMEGGYKDCSSMMIAYMAYSLLNVCEPLSGVKRLLVYFCLADKLAKSKY